MPLPDIPHYQEAMRTWQTSLNAGDPKTEPLRSGRPLLRPMKRAGKDILEPIYWNGDWAVVYRFDGPIGPRAVRCQRRRSQKFMHDVVRRYRCLRTQLDTYRPRSFVGIDTIEEGLMAAGEMRPLITMDWVEGVRLNRFLLDRLVDGDLWRIREATQEFLENVLDLERHGIAHGDLQERNILIGDDNRMKFIDYDSVYCETLRSEFESNLQGGHSNYQHPSRNAPDFDGTLDRFSAIVILLSMVAAYRDPPLWREVVAPGGAPHDQQMLFVKGDFLEPEVSPVFRYLLGSRDAYMRRMAELTLEALKARRLTEIRTFESMLLEVPGCAVKGQFKAPPLNPNLRLHRDGRGAHGGAANHPGGTLSVLSPSAPLPPAPPSIMDPPVPPVTIAIARPQGAVASAPPPPPPPLQGHERASPTPPPPPPPPPPLPARIRIPRPVGAG